MDDMPRDSAVALYVDVSSSSCWLIPSTTVRTALLVDGVCGAGRTGPRGGHWFWAVARVNLEQTQKALKSTVEVCIYVRRENTDLVNR